MLAAGHSKILAIINENRQILEKENITANSDFPANDERLINALALILENTCLLGDFILHFPDISFKILRKTEDWKELANWSINYSKEFKELLDFKSLEMLNLFNQEINEEARTEDYRNPYRRENTPKVITTKKLRKRLPKGPQLSGRTEL